MNGWIKGRGEGRGGEGERGRGAGLGSVVHLVLLTSDKALHKDDNHTRLVTS